jgi:FtsZ-interacting cell division protein YlmF
LEGTEEREEKRGRERERKRGREREREREGERGREREEERERERERCEEFLNGRKGRSSQINVVRQRCWKFAIGVLINSIVYFYLNGDLARGTTATF